MSGTRHILVFGRHIVSSVDDTSSSSPSEIWIWIQGLVSGTFTGEIAEEGDKLKPFENWSTYLTMVLGNITRRRCQIQPSLSARTAITING